MQNWPGREKNTKLTRSSRRLQQSSIDRFKFISATGGDRGTALSRCVRTPAAGSSGQKQTFHQSIVIVARPGVVPAATAPSAYDRPLPSSLDDRPNPLRLRPPASLFVGWRSCPVILEECEVDWNGGTDVQRLQRAGPALGDDKVIGSTVLKMHAAQMCLHGRASSCGNPQLHLRAPTSTDRNSFRDVIRWTSNNVSECWMTRSVRH